MAVRMEQPRNSAEKVKFSVSRTVVPTRQLTVFDHIHMPIALHTICIVSRRALCSMFNGIVHMSLLILVVQACPWDRGVLVNSIHMYW